MKFLYTLPIFFILSGCMNPDVSEAEGYVHIQEEKVVCTEVSKDIVTVHSRGGPRTYLDTKSKCMFFKTTREEYNERAIKEKELLRKELMK